MCIPQLTNVEKLILQNTMLRMALEQKQLEEARSKVMVLEGNLRKIQSQLETWQNKFNKRLKKNDLDITKVFIDADNGVVSLLEEQT